MSNWARAWLRDVCKSVFSGGVAKTLCPNITKDIKE